MTNKERLKKCRLYTGDETCPDIPEMAAFWCAEANWVDGRHFPLNEGETAKTILKIIGDTSTSPNVPQSLLVEMYVLLRRKLIGQGFDEEQIVKKFAALFDNYIKITSK
ncbi:MAG: hypothetical protein IJV22_05610 [Bacteroidales bacterium]|nr:hypothetical protein [Bacteroidales bacterium]